MRILFAIAHYYYPQGSGDYGSLSKNPLPRILALESCIAHLQGIFGNWQCEFDISRCSTISITDKDVRDIDVVICTTRDRHLLDRLSVPKTLYRHHPTDVNPPLLGFECQALLRDRLGEYDYYCYLEDDLTLHDPWFFIKLNWFNKNVGNLALLQPNRYEIGHSTAMSKAYIDGDIDPEYMSLFQDIRDRPELKGYIMERPVSFKRPLNPHSGCYFLNDRQMAYWSKQPHFFNRDTSFIGPLESAATLGIMKTFTIYKPARPDLGFLEIQHSGTAFLSLLGKQVKIE